MEGRKCEAHEEQKEETGSGQRPPGVQAAALIRHISLVESQRLFRDALAIPFLVALETLLSGRRPHGCTIAAQAIVLLLGLFTRFRVLGAVFDSTLVQFVGCDLVFGQAETIRHATLSEAAGTALTSAVVGSTFLVDAVGLATRRRCLAEPCLVTDESLEALATGSAAAVLAALFIEALLLALLDTKSGIIARIAEATVAATTAAAVGTALLARALWLTYTLAQPLEVAELASAAHTAVAAAAIGSTLFAGTVSLAVLHAQPVLAELPEAAVPTTAVAAVVTTLFAAAIRLTDSLANPLEVAELAAAAGSTLVAAAVRATLLADTVGLARLLTETVDALGSPLALSTAPAAAVLTALLAAAVRHTPARAGAAVVTFDLVGADGIPLHVAAVGIPVADTGFDGPVGAACVAMR